MKTRPPIYSLSMLALVVIILYINTSASQPLTANQMESDSDEVEQWPIKEKRPFCNAFAGCGRKRALMPIKEGRSSSYEKSFDSRPRPLNTETNKLLDKLFARLHNYRTSSSQLDEMEYK